MTTTIPSSPGTATDRVVLDALSVRGTYTSRRREIITDTSGVEVAEMSSVPNLFVEREIAAQRRIKPLPYIERARIIDRAADLFATATIAGLSFDQYASLAARVSGLPITTAIIGAKNVAQACRDAVVSTEAARPRGAVLDWREDAGRQGTAVWARRGQVYGVHASGNTVGRVCCTNR